MDLNRVTIIGNVTKDPETRTTPSGQNVTNFSIATNKSWTDTNGAKQEKVEFHNLIAWRKLSDVVQQYVKKGAKLYVEGELQTRSWDDPSGVKKYRTEIIVSSLIMLDRREAGSNNGEIDLSTPAPTTTTPTTTAAPKAQDSEEEISIDEIPF